MLVRRFRLAGPLLAGLLVLLQGPMVRAQSSKLYNPTAFLIDNTYQVGDLLAQKDRLVEYLLRNVEPESWQGQGGEGTIEFFPLGSTLLVRQSPDIQEKIADCLEQFRREIAQSRTNSLSGLENAEATKDETRQKKVSRLLKRYRQACKQGDLRKAKKLAHKALELDPTCFDSARETGRRVEDLLHQSEARGWSTFWFGPRTADRVHGAIE